MQERWENREYVVEKWPYPNILVYVVCLRNGEGCSLTLHRNYLLLINSNMGQGKADESEERVKNNTSLTPVPSADSIWQDSPDWPAPVRHSTQTTRNQLPWRYWNFGLSTGTRPTGIWNAWVDLCLFAHSSLFVHHFLERCSVEHTLLIAKYACWAHLTLASRGTLSMQL